jgi:hypothetical protein
VSAQPLELIFVDTQLPDDLMKKAVPDLRAAVRGDGRRAS